MKKESKEKATNQILAVQDKTRKCKKLLQLHLVKNMNSRNQVDKTKIGTNLKERNKSKLLLVELSLWQISSMLIMINSITQWKIMKLFYRSETH